MKKIILTLYFFNFCVNAKFICIIGSNMGFNKELFENSPYRTLLKETLIQRGHKVLIVDNFNELIKCDVIVSFYPVLWSLKDYMHLSSKNILFLEEPPMHIYGLDDKRLYNNWHKIYTLLDDYVDNINFFKFFYIDVNDCKLIKDIYSFSCKKLCTLISRYTTYNNPKALYIQRVKAIDFFSQNYSNDFDLYGERWPEKMYSTYRGPVVDKVEILRKYKFCICYENSECNGYVTEKIFDCMAAGCVPIYWGAPNIEKYIPKNCFIDKKQFDNYEKLYEFIHSMKEFDYMNYLKNIEQFFNSDKAKPFLIQTFIEKVIYSIEN